MSLTACLSNEVALLVIHLSFHASSVHMHLVKLLLRIVIWARWTKPDTVTYIGRKKLNTQNESVVLLENFQPNQDLQVMEFMPAARFVKNVFYFFPPNLRQVSQKMRQVLERKIYMNST